MKPFLFVIEVRPNPDNPQGRGIGGAMAHVWVFDPSLKSARTKAFNHLNSHGWTVKEVAHEFAPTPGQIGALDEPEYANYRQAELNGIAMELLAWPKKERIGGKNIYVQPLKKPKSSD